MAWVQLEDNFVFHPKFNHLARRVGISPATARGLAAGLWSWCINFAFDGNITKFDPADIEEAIGWIHVRSRIGSDDPTQIGSDDPARIDSGGELIEAMIGVGLIDRIGDQVVIHEWDDRPNSHKDRLARRRRRVDSKEPGADDPVNAADCPVNAAARRGQGSPPKPSLENRNGNDQGGSEVGSPITHSPIKKKKPRKPKMAAAHTDLIEAWNRGASGCVSKTSIGSRKVRDQKLAAVLSDYPETGDPAVWEYIARAMSADEHQGKTWKARGRLLWLIEPSKRAHLERWLEAGIQLREKSERAARIQLVQPEPLEVGAQPAEPRRTDQEFESMGAQARALREQFKR